MWSDENLSASGHTYSGCVYSMMRTTTNQGTYIIYRCKIKNLSLLLSFLLSTKVDFHIDVAKGVKVTHIIQIAANWQGNI